MSTQKEQKKHCVRKSTAGAHVASPCTETRRPGQHIRRKRQRKRAPDLRHATACGQRKVGLAKHAHRLRYWPEQWPCKDHLCRRVQAAALHSLLFAQQTLQNPRVRPRRSSFPPRLPAKPLFMVSTAQLLWLVRLLHVQGACASQLFLVVMCACTSCTCGAGRTGTTALRARAGACTGTQQKKRKEKVVFPALCFLFQRQAEREGGAERTFAKNAARNAGFAEHSQPLPAHARTA